MNLLLDLPLETLKCIFGFLHMSQLIRLERISKRFRDLLVKCNYGGRHMVDLGSIDANGLDCADVDKCVLSKIGGGLQKLVLRGNCSFMNTYLDFVPTHCLGLKVLEIPHVAFDGAEICIPGPSSLKSLKISFEYSKVSNTFDKLFQALRHFSHLRTLDLELGYLVKDVDNTTALGLLRDLAELRELSLGGFSEKNLTPLSCAETRPPSLQYIFLDELHPLNCDGDIIKNLSGLKSVGIAGNVSATVMQKVSPAFTCVEKITRLDSSDALDGDFSCSVSALNAIRDQCPQLSQLRLTGNYPANAVACLMETLGGKLAKLEFFSNYTLTDETLLQIATVSKGLSFLSIWFNTRMECLTGMSQEAMRRYANNHKIRLTWNGIVAFAKERARVVENCHGCPLEFKIVSCIAKLQYCGYNTQDLNFQHQLFQETGTKVVLM